MKKYYLLLVLGILALAQNLSAQTGGIDKIVSDIPAENQTVVDIAVAFNGWTYAVVSNTNGTDSGYRLLSSRNNGASWTTIDNLAPTDYKYTTLDIEVAGTDTNNLTLYLVGVNNSISGGTYVLYIDKYNATTGAFSGGGFYKSFGTRQVYDVAIATDYELPAVGANPYSVGVVYSVYSPSIDSVNFILSTDGGATFAQTGSIAQTGSYFRNVAIAYGKSASASNGRYFFAWDRFASTNARNGHIYTSRNTSTVDGGFIPPVNLDSLSSSCINLCSAPSIAVSYSTTDNDSGACTAIVSFQRDYNADGSDHDILAFSNERSHFTNFWFRRDISNTGSNQKHPSIIYDSATSNFYGTFADSTNAKLLKFTIGLNTPETVNLDALSYNDAPLSWGTKQVMPKIAKSVSKTYPEFVWVNNNANVGTAFYNAEQIQLTITSALSSPTNSQNIPVTFTFSEAVTNFDLADVVVTNGTLLNFAGSGATYTATLSAIGGIATISVANDVATLNNAASTFSIDYQPLGVNEVNAQDLFKVFPNPTTGMVYVNGHDNANPINTIRVFSINGQLIDQLNVKGATNSSFDISNLQAGIYLVEITLTNGSRGVSRIVKM